MKLFKKPLRLAWLFLGMLMGGTFMWLLFSREPRSLPVVLQLPLDSRCLLQENPNSSTEKGKSFSPKRSERLGEPEENPERYPSEQEDGDSSPSYPDDDLPEDSEEEENMVEVALTI